MQSQAEKDRELVAAEESAAKERLAKIDAAKIEVASLKKAVNESNGEVRKLNAAEKAEV